MRHEHYFQYTSRWHRVSATMDIGRQELIDWCLVNGTENGGFHAHTYDWIPYRKIDHVFRSKVEMRFERMEDATLFKIVWVGEEEA